MLYLGAPLANYADDLRQDQSGAEEQGISMFIWI